METDPPRRLDYGGPKTPDPVKVHLWLTRAVAISFFSICLSFAWEDISWAESDKLPQPYGSLDLDGKLHDLIWGQTHLLTFYDDLWLYLFPTLATVMFVLAVRSDKGRDWRFQFPNPMDWPDSHRPTRPPGMPRLFKSTVLIILAAWIAPFVANFILLFIWFPARMPRPG
jgi:hypothetical protein